MQFKNAIKTTYKKLHWVRQHIPKPLRKKLGAFYRTRVEYKKGPERKFLETIETKTITKNLFFYESFHGKSINCSPFAIFKKISESDEQGDITHVWSLSDPNLMPEEIKNRNNVSIVAPNSDAYAETLATANIIISNSTLPTWYIRRENQKYVNTWHGVPLKKMFKHENADHPTVHRNSQRNFLQASHLLLQNEFTASALLGSADIEEAASSKTVCVGAPRVDETLNTDPSALRRELGIEEGQKLIFIAPTWRGELGKPAKKNAMLDSLVNQLGKLPAEEYVIFAQTHNFTMGVLKNTRPIPTGISTNRFLAAVDILISDYSSIMFDYLATGRQLILYVYDRAEYEEIRGLNFPLEALPAHLCMRPHEVLDAIMDGRRSDELSQYSKAKKIFFPLEDGNATSRAISAIKSQNSHQNTCPNIIFFGGGWKNNGITSSFLNLIHALEVYDLNIYVLTDGLPLEKSEELRANLQRAGSKVRLLHKAGPMPHTLEEQKQLERFYATNRFENQKHEATITAMFRREARRLVGDLEFDAAVDFSGYSRYWSLVTAMLSAKRHTIYQHNDMNSEAEKRFDVLKGVFAAYKWFDVVASVSEETMKLNVKNLGARYVRPGAAASVRNVIRPEHIRKQATEPLPKHLDATKRRPTFVMAGRLSPEKAQDRAIRALATLRSDGTEANLILMGTGPLEGRLKAEARKYGVEDLVIFAGHVDNPFPVIAHGDCFLLTSDYEGQPMVLLEALTLGKPVIATDIPGARSVLGEQYGHLVSPTDEAVAHGMQHFINGHVTGSSFDAEEYCEAALQDFFDIVLGLTPKRSTPRQIDAY